MFRNFNSMFNIKKIWEKVKSDSGVSASSDVNGFLTGAIMAVMGIYAAANVFMSLFETNDEEKMKKNGESKEDKKQEAETKEEDASDYEFDFGAFLQSTANLIGVLQRANLKANTIFTTAKCDANEVANKAKETADVVEETALKSFKAIEKAGMYAQSKATLFSEAAKTTFSQFADEVRAVFKS